MEYSVRKKSGRGFNGAERDQGHITHAVIDSIYNGPSFEEALCGTRPGYKGNGWGEPEKQGVHVTCSKCLMRLAAKE